MSLLDFASKITVRGKVPEAVRTSRDRAGFERAYRELLDDMNRMASHVGWRGAAVCRHGYSGKDGTIEIEAGPGKVPATLDHVKAVARGSAR